MSELKNNSKVYLEIVEKIREIIGENQLEAGDRLPSEREFAENLKAGRSSVREALRSLELLGLIETKRGEGTFIADFRNHRLVEIISGFILQNEQGKKDVGETKSILERAAIERLIEQKKQPDFHFQSNHSKADKDSFFEYLIYLTDNRLLLKIWRILAKFEQSLYMENAAIETPFFDELFLAIRNEDVEKANKIYNEILKKSAAIRASHINTKE